MDFNRFFIEKYIDAKLSMLNECKTILSFEKIYDGAEAFLIDNLEEKYNSLYLKWVTGIDTILDTIFVNDVSD